jgi:hypothetical protein
VWSLLAGRARSLCVLNLRTMRAFYWRFRQSKPKLETILKNKPSAKLFQKNNPFLRRQEGWRGRSVCVARRSGEADSASPPRVARHEGVRRQGEWRSTLGLVDLPRPAPDLPHPSLSLPHLSLPHLWRRRRRVVFFPLTLPPSPLPPSSIGALLIFTKVCSSNPPSLIPQSPFSNPLP